MIRISSPIMENEEINAVIDVLKSGMIVQGGKVQEFEEKFSSFIGKSHGIATSSGTSALQISMQSLGLKKGDEVITTPFTFISTANSILYTGAKPVFVDIDETYNINPDLIEEKINDRTKALLIVHLYGNMCNMDKILKICEKHNLKLIEDCAQSIGSEQNGKMAGTFGDVACFSFYATKNMTTGEGGMILTDNKEIEEKCRLLRNHGQIGTYEHSDLSYNYRMTNIAGAIGLSQLQKLEEFNRKRIENAKYLNEMLAGIPDLVIPIISNSCKHTFHQYTIRVLNSNRNLLQEHLKQKDIESKVYYPKPIHLQQVYEKLGYNEGPLPISEQASEEVLSLPVHPLLSKEDMEKIVSEVKNGLGRR